ncbi:MAG: hypothetical protein NVSMB42_05980 [Herpetosiphon sp.]
MILLTPNNAIERRATARVLTLVALAAYLPGSVEAAMYPRRRYGLTPTMRRMVLAAVDQLLVQLRQDYCVIGRPYGDHSTGLARWIGDLANAERGLTGGLN